MQFLPLAFEQYACQVTVQQVLYLLQKRRRMVRLAVSRESSKKVPLKEIQYILYRNFQLFLVVKVAS